MGAIGVGREVFAFKSKDSESCDVNVLSLEGNRPHHLPPSSTVITNELYRYFGALISENLSC